MSTTPRRFKADYYKLPYGDKLLAIKGVPLQYLKKDISLDKFNFNVITSKYQEKIITIAPKTQADFIRTVLGKIGTFGQSAIYAIGSFPTEQASYELATLLCRSYNEWVLNEGSMPELCWIDMGHPEWSFLKEETTPDVVVVHGINDQIDAKRLEIVRDFIRKSANSTALILCNTSNVLDFSINRLGIMPDVCWQLGKTSHRKVV